LIFALLVANWQFCINKFDLIRSEDSLCGSSSPFDAPTNVDYSRYCATVLKTKGQRGQESCTVCRHPEWWQV